MSIFPLPVFEADADPHHRSSLSDEEVYAALKPPTSVVVRFGALKLVGEYRYEGDARPGCGTKLVVRTHRGTEIGEMLTTTCANAGCGKSVTRQEMLAYVDNSGGRDFPFYSGRVLRVATIEDLNKQSALDTDQSKLMRTCREQIRALDLPMRLVDVEQILGGELITFYYLADERVDFRELVRNLAAEYHTRIEMRQVGARDEARLTADYERCGQYCCCKNFLKVLKPVSMKSAKVQKATLDPLKISGRCGRLMCCLRYEDHTYKELKASLPRKSTRVGTTEGPGVVVDGRILVQLVLVRLEHDGREIAVPVEELLDPETCPRPGEMAARLIGVDPLRGMPADDLAEKVEEGDAPPERRRRRRRRRRKGASGETAEAGGEAQARGGKGGEGGEKPQKGGRPPKKKTPGAEPGPRAGEETAGGADRPDASADGKPRRRRRRRRRGGRHKAGDGGGGGGGEQG